MTKLYELAGDYLALARMSGDPEVPDQAIIDTMEGIEGAIEVKAENLLTVVKNIEADVVALKAEAARLLDRAKVKANTIEKLREYLRQNMEVTGIHQISCTLFLISLAKGVPMVILDDEMALPDDLVKVETTRKPIKADILRALKAGRDIPGAHLGKSRSSLRIK
jgi:hypothetical protein